MAASCARTSARSLIAAAWLALAVFPASAWAGPCPDDFSGPGWIHDAIDLHIHFAAHRERLPLLAEDIMNKFPSLFGTLRKHPGLVAKFFAKHDISKVGLSQSFYDKHGMSESPKSISEKLYQILGLRVDPKADPTVVKLNEIDKSEKAQLLKEVEESLPAEEAREFEVEIERLEDCADLEDRGMDRVSRCQELRKTDGSPADSGADYLEEKAGKLEKEGHTDEARELRARAKIIRTAERDYPEVVSGHDFSDVRAKHRVYLEKHYADFHSGNHTVQPENNGEERRAGPRVEAGPQPGALPCATAEHEIFDILRGKSPIE